MVDNVVTGWFDGWGNVWLLCILGMSHVGGVQHIGLYVTVRYVVCTGYTLCDSVLAKYVYTSK